jgi:DNA-binding NarL/FixJ family response regulator
MTRTNDKRRSSCAASSCPRRRTVRRGAANPNVCGLCTHAWRGISRISRLSKCETEVLHRIVEGEADKQIAKELGTTCNTVRTQIARLRLKLRESRRVGLVVAAFRLHLKALRQAGPLFGCNQK